MSRYRNQVPPPGLADGLHDPSAASIASNEAGPEQGRSPRLSSARPWAPATAAERQR